MKATKDITTELLKASLTSSPEQRRAALRIMRGEIPVASDSEASLLLKPGPAARFLGVSKATFWRLVQKGRLKPVQITNKASFFRRRDIAALVEATTES